MTSPAYLIVSIDVHDPEVFAQYAGQAVPLLQENGAEILAATPNLTIEWGEWPRQRLTLIKFPSLQKAEDFYRSDAYQPMKALRQSASDGELILVQGQPDTEPETQSEATAHYLLGSTTMNETGWITEYMQKVPPVSAKFGVQGLIMGNDFTVLEGSWPRESLVLLKLPSEKAYQDFWFGEEYRAMKELREANTVADHVSFAGVVE
ncbi:MAG: DUF1330 domain-containing protein [Gammaproteobacteria bacterium]|nr:DUF1330 domain-containing protein [Gammaproteobacteria bacterium]